MQPNSFDEFWPYYLTQHAQPRTRALHIFGTLTAVALLTAAVATSTWQLALAAPVAGYAFAWLAHGLVEHNKPATFGHPGWSLRADFKMCRLWLTGGLGAELEKAGVRRA